MILADDNGSQLVLDAVLKAASMPSAAREDFNEAFNSENWPESLMVFLDPQLHEVEGFFDSNGASLISKLMASAHTLDITVLILNALLKTATELQQRYAELTSPIIPKLSKLLDSLPDDILPSIFEYAVWMEELDTGGSQQAISLSHVSRKFRRISLATRSLWMSLRTNASNDELVTFSARSGSDPNFRVFWRTRDLEASGCNEPEPRCVSFTNTCGPTMSRWNSLNLEIHSDKLIFNEQEMDTLGCTFGVLRGDDENPPIFPHLEELALNADPYRYTRSSTAFTCRAPKLQSLRCFRYIPLPSTTFFSVTDCELNIDFSGDCLYAASTQTLAFLECMSSLQVLSLELVGVGSKAVELLLDLVQLTASTYPAVISFSLRLSHLSASHGIHAHLNFLSSFLGAILMPRLEEMSITINPDMCARDDLKDPCLLGALSRAVLPRQLLASDCNVRSVEYNLIELGETLFEHDAGKLNRHVFPVDLRAIPSVMKISFSSSIGVNFCNLDGEELYSKSIQSSRQLREINFIDNYDLCSDAVSCTIQSLKDCNAWDGIERFIVSGYGRARYNELVQLVGKEKLVYLP